MPKDNSADGTANKILTVLSELGILKEPEKLSTKLV